MQYKGLAFTETILTVIAISLLPTVLCAEIGVGSEVLSNSTAHSDGHKFPRSPSNNTLNAFRLPDRSNTELLGRKYSNNNSEVEYLVVQDASLNATEMSAIGMAGDLLGDLMTRNFTAGDSANGLEWLQKVYNPHLWGPLPPGELGTECGADMKMYLAALSNGTVWAAKSKQAYI
jgi:hypothetical protein